jgi:hypothetical protein
MKIQKYIRKKLLFYVGFLLIVLFQSCKFEVKEFSMPYSSEDVEKLTDDEKLWCLNRSVDRLDCECATVILESGVDPDCCLGDCGWATSNPIGVVTHSYYDTYWRYFYGDIDELKEPLPDVLTLSILVKSGADINKRPYVWQRVYEISNQDIASKWKDRPTRDGVREGVYEDMRDYTIKDANRVLKTLLELGADPDMLGHPYPFSYEAMEAGITDKQAKKYFEKGTRAINEAIEKGMAWESQVDLLLQYTYLDEESLNAAQRSGDPEMIKKIQKLWEKQ